MFGIWFGVSGQEQHVLTKLYLCHACVYNSDISVYIFYVSMYVHVSTTMTTAASLDTVNSGNCCC